MSVRGAHKASEVSSTTRNKHVVALGDQAATAQAGYGSSTFVTSTADLTDAVDANAHDFIGANGVASARFDFEASVKIYLYDKTEAPPAGFAKGKPVSKTIDGVATTCEIGVKKTGDDKIQVTHFKKK
jgi:hypothetical protein